MKPVYHLLNLFRFTLTSGTKFIFEKMSLYKGYFLKATLLGLAISMTVTLLAWIGYFKPYQNPLTDLLHSITHRKANDVVLLFITEKEYKEGFHGISPLQRGRLAELVDLMVKFKAKVIALDIDLSDPSPEDQKLSDAVSRASAAGIPIVVVGNVKAIEKKTQPGDDSSDDLHPYSVEKLHSVKDGLMLFEEVSPGHQWVGKVIYGGVLFRLDNDGVFRTGEGLYMIKKNDLKDKHPYLPVPAFPVAVVAAYQGMSQEVLMEALLNVHDQKIALPSSRGSQQKEISIPMVKGGRVIPNFIGNYEHFDREVNLKRLLEEYRSNDAEGVTIFKDKIVLIGGTYDKRDFYMTPVGRMSGMEILANITQSIVSATLITPTSFWKAFVIQIILGIAVAFVFILFSRFWATVICLSTFIPGIVVASFLSFSSSHYWFDFVPTIAGVIIYGRIRKAEKVFERVKETLGNRLKKKLKTIQTKKIIKRDNV
jgi:CHASE2 domain-containing sensor protein